MKTRTATLLSLIALLLGAVVGAGPTAQAAQAAPGPRPAPPARGAAYAIPEVGSCWDYTYRAALRRSDPSAPVACTGPHTAQTIKVVTVRSLRSDKALAAAYVGCVKALRRTVGQALARTAYTYRFFLPSKKEARRGARWVRCDVVLAAGRTLAPLPTPLVAPSVTDATGLCAVTLRNVTIRTVCAAEHGYRYTAGYRAKGKRYPGRDALLRSVIVACAKVVSTPRKFWAFYPDQTDWRAGRRAVSCLSRSRA